MNDQLENMYKWDGPVTYLVVVDKDDNVIGDDTFINVHEKKMLHRGSVVFVFNDKGEVMLPRRSLGVIFPMHFSCSAGGHVDKGNDYETTAKNELKEELNLDIPIKYAGKIFIKENHEFVSVYTARYNKTPDFDSKEVERIEWFSKDEIDLLIRRFPYIFMKTVVRVHNELDIFKLNED